MGRKYASIHIPHHPKEYTEQDVRRYYGKKLLTADEAVERFIDQYLRLSKASWGKAEYPPQAAIDMERQLYQENQMDIVCRGSEHFWSVFDGEQSFATIAGKAKDISEKMDSPVLYAANFDDDLFLMGVYQKGECKTHMAIGRGLEEYEVEPACLDAAAFSACFPFADEAKTKLISKAKAIGKAEKLVSKLLSIPLWEKQSV